jgi:phosphate:Na+ symporter
MGTIVLLDLMGGVALLLWGLHMVQSGILRAFAPDLRHLLSKTLSNRFAAFAAGLGLTALLQSSTATGLMTASFAAEGLVGLVPALALMLGANVGTTLIVQVLSLNVAAAAPVLFVIGLIAFRTGARTRVKDLGRVAIGLGLVLLALHILLDTLAPAEDAPGVRVLLNAITGDPILCILIAAGLTWAAHSSVATVLLIMSLAYSSFVTPAAALALVLGANLGSAINPVLEGGHRDDPASYRLPVGNLLNRLVGVVLVAPFLRPIADAFIAFQPDAAKMTAEFHIVFNVGLALAFIGLLDPLAWLLKRTFPGCKRTEDPARVQYAALPYRRRANLGTEVMLVTSRGTGRWIIPKGWPMKRGAPHVAAAREALEEAGVVGQVGTSPIGSYSYEKRLKQGDVVVCEVHVFPLEVRSQKKSWREKGEREVQWFSSAEAAETVQEPVLSDIIRSLHKQP